MYPFIWLVDTIIQIVIFIIIVQAILSWLIAFELVNPRVRAVQAVWSATTRLTNPLYAPLRRVVPNLGGIDITPMILVVGLLFLQQLVHAYLV